MKTLITVVAVACLGTAAWAQTPSITAVQDAGSYTANIAQGSIFVVKGSNLSSATTSGGFSQAGFPLPATLASVKITFTPTAGGAGTDAYMVYTYNIGGVNQLAALLPSTVKAGDYNVTVTNGTAVSPAFKTTVVARKFEIIAADGSGTGVAVIQNFISSSQYDLNRYTSGTVGGFTYSPAHPGQVLVLWGTGIGAITTADNVAVPGLIDFRSNAAVRVLVNGTTITPDIYAGRAPGLAGTDEIIFTLPAGVAAGCTASVQVSVDGQLSNTLTLSIAAAGADACSSAQYTKDTLTRLDQGGALTTGSFALVQFSTSLTVPGIGNVTAKVESAAGSFTKITGAQLSSNPSLFDTSGTCQVYHRVGDTTSLLLGGSATTLDAGANLTLTGPASLNKQVPRTAGNVYSLSLGTALSGITLPPGVTLPPGLGFSTTPLLVAGNYTLTGAGGADVKGFTASVTLGSALTVTGGLPANVNRSQPLTLSWTGGNPTDVVEILGYAGSNVGGTTSSPTYDATVFICTTTAGKGSLTVPVSVLSQLPAVAASAVNSGTGTSALGVLSTTAPSGSNGLFTAPLVAGGNIDAGVFVGTVGTLTQPSFQ